MKRIDETVARFSGEDGDELAIRHSSRLAATGTITLSINCGWGGREIAVELSHSDVTALRDTLRALETNDRAQFKVEDGELVFSARYDNMGEPYREGVCLSLDDPKPFPPSIFLETRRRNDLRVLLDKLLS